MFHKLLEDGDVERQPISERMAHYIVPKALGRTESATAIPAFGEPLSDRCLLWPHARAHRDQQRVQLISVECDDGWYHDVAYPGYMWADTPNLWRAPGLTFSGSSNEHVYAHEPLNTEFEELCR